MGNKKKIEWVKTICNRLFSSSSVELLENKFRRAFRIQKEALVKIKRTQALEGKTTNLKDP
ncbi:hypothetical protein HanHA300_Chr04g0124651 [Helianthus annuus]|nr:hypothetical protein HanHA300_Chr04g0124651 [Helianthus annuus]